MIWGDYFGDLAVPTNPSGRPRSRGRCKPCSDRRVPGVPTVPRAANASLSATQRVVLEYRFADSDGWRVVLGAPGQTYEQLVDSVHQRFPDVAEVRPYRRGRS